VRIFSKLGMMVALAAPVGLPQAPKSPPPKSPPKSQPQIQEVRATGCVRRLPDGCLILRTLDGSTAYTFLASPRPESGIVITIQGTAHQGASSCKQGIAIDVTDWEPTDQKCTQ
jgi:hypothetical protein